MSVAGVSSVVSPYIQGPQSGPSSPTPNSRRAEDAAARQLIADLEKGDLADAQQAYNTLASFGPNNSGPWAAGSQMQSEFQQLGQDLSSGNLTAAQGDAKTLAGDQIANDVQVAKQDYESGNMAAYNQAVQNYTGDYWAIFGSLPQSASQIGGGSPVVVPGISVQA